MNQQPIFTDVVDVFGVDFEVVDHHRGAALRGDARDLGEVAVGLSESFSGAELSSDDEGLAVFAPHRVGVGDAEGFGFGGDFEFEDVGREVFHRAGDDHAAGAVVRFDLRTRVDGDHTSLTVEAHFGHDQMDRAADVGVLFVQPWEKQRGQESLIWRLEQKL